jgi:hypothetical protein
MIKALICRLMSDLVRRAEEGVSCGRRQDEGGPEQGRAAGVFSPKSYCAAIIAEAWSFIHGVEPAPTKSEGCGRRTPPLEGIVGGPEHGGDEAGA